MLRLWRFGQEEPDSEIGVFTVYVFGNAFSHLRSMHLL